jgi:hypothetical protein
VLPTLSKTTPCAHFLDALAFPDGRDVRKAWNDVLLLYGRFASVMQRSAFEQYLDELAGVTR